MNWKLGSTSNRFFTRLRQLASLRCMLVIGLTLDTVSVLAQEPAVGAKPARDFSRLSIEDLANVEISSVSKRAESLRDAAATIYVITRDDIRRYGATSIPEVLRLAPNLEVARIDSNQYAISARGFNQSSANKLLVLIDGRVVYTTINSGVFWNMQDVLLDDVERVEVISGPGGALWGSNAVNGVINILTRPSRDTVGTLVSVGTGTQERDLAVRYGVRLNEDTGFRLYAKGFDRDHSSNANGVSLLDQWHKAQAGFRMDWNGARDAVTLQGDAFHGSAGQKAVFTYSKLDRTLSGANLLGRWNRNLGDGAGLQIQAYYDRTRINTPTVFGDELDTYDIDLQHHFSWSERQDIVWGGGHRRLRNHIDGSPLLFGVPPDLTLSLTNVFLQDTITLTDQLKLTLGAKLEHNHYTGWESQPSARLAWRLNEHSLLWGAISRAVRTPSRVDRDIVFDLQPPLVPFPFKLNVSNFQSEKLTAYEVGYRAQPTSRLSYSISVFYNVYGELRSTESAGGGALVFVNKQEGRTYGVETWGSYQVNEGWRLSAGYNALHERITPYSTLLGSTSATNNDPAYQFSLRSSVNLPRDLEFDATLRRVGGLSNPNVPAFTALDARLGWHINKAVELSLTGVNLLDRRHPEFGDASGVPGRAEVERSVYLRLTWKL